MYKFQLVFSFWGLSAVLHYGEHLSKEHIKRLLTFPCKELLKVHKFCTTQNKYSREWIIYMSSYSLRYILVKSMRLLNIHVPFQGFWLHLGLEENITTVTVKVCDFGWLWTSVSQRKIDGDPKCKIILCIEATSFTWSKIRML